MSAFRQRGKDQPHNERRFDHLTYSLTTRAFFARCLPEFDIT
jgi:hypothetical protein